MRPLILILLITSAAFAQAGNETTEGGNISQVNATTDQASSWYGVCGQALPAAFVPVTINATPGNTTCLTINTGASSCTNGLVGTIHLLFSNGSSAIASLAPGNLPLLDIFINRESENGTATFTSLSSFSIPGFGTVASVPTTYTNSPVPSTFKMGYLQDQAGNIVIVTPLVSDQVGFNGSVFDFQLMLPTNNVTPTLYYLTAAKECAPPPPGGKPPQGGGGTHTPYYNVTQPPEPPPPPPPPPGYECGSDLNCADSEYCDILPGQSGGNCREVIGQCGYAQNHTWATYECGNETLCPTCLPAYSCVDHSCVLYELDVPKTGMVGENVTLIARENGVPCVSCDIEITDPAGSKFYGKTNSEGRLTFQLTLEGIYGVALIKNGLQLKSVILTSLKPAAAEKPPEQPMPQELALCLALIVLLLILTVVYIMRTKKPKEVTPKK
jgi:hypothetical protein